MKMKPKFEFVNGSLWEEKKEIPVARNCDVAIAGGGPSGLAAAIASARTGADTLLVESQSFLGGVATSTMMAALVDAKRANGISEENGRKEWSSPAFNGKKCKYNTI